MDLTPILAVPGALLLALWNPSGFAKGTEAHAALAISLGLVFWMLLLMIVLLSRRRWHRGAEASAGSAVALVHAGWQVATRHGRWFAGRLTWRSAWGMVWRAEVAHLAVYALLPLGWAAGRAVLFVLFMPFSVMSFADQPGETGGFDHLRRPACWTFVSLCASPGAQFRGPTAIEQSACRRGEGCPALRIPYSDRWQMAWKLSWAVLATLWIAGWWRSRAVALPERSAHPGHDRGGASREV